jgi:rhodanese-related sulfurtransferase
MVRVIEIDDLKAALDAGKVDELYDNRGPGSYGAMHIKGAKLLPVPDAAQGKDLPADKDAMLVFY